jgi:hypothetical protein
MSDETKPDDDGCGHRWKEGGLSCTLDKNHGGDVHEMRDIRGRLIGAWVDDVNEQHRLARARRQPR